MDNRTNGRPMAPPATLRELREWHWRLVEANRAKASGWRARAFAKKAEWHMKAVEALDAAISLLDAAKTTATYG